MRLLAALLAPLLFVGVIAPDQSPAAAVELEQGTAAAMLGSLTVGTPYTVGYDRDLFTHWIDADSDGCDTRREVLIAEATVAPAVGPGCALSAGQWTSWYDGAVWTDATQLEIDHVVPLKEAWVSGAQLWSADVRKAFANDLDNPGSLEAVTSAVNSSKGASDPARWLPPLASAHCTYATEWVRVKYRWRLAIDDAEHAALANILSGDCGAAAVEIPERAVDASATVVQPPAGVVGVQRLSGTDRYGTAVRISQEFSAGVPVVYIASGTGYADALSAAPAAARQGGPLLLVPPTSVPAVVVAELQRLKPALIVVAGGAGAVSDSSYASLSALAPAIRRDGGADRYATGRLIVQRAFTDATSAYVATGANFPDALSASAAAGAASAPVMLVNGRAAAIGAVDAALLTSLGVSQVTVAGGTSVVSSGIESSLRQVLGVDSVVRASGSDRYATSASINRLAFGSVQRAFFSAGTGFADALAGAALAGAVGAPLFVVPKSCVSATVRDHLTTMGTTGFTLLGGTGVLSDAVADLTVCPVVVPPAPPKPPTPPAPPAPPKNPGDTKNCTDFATYAAALAWFNTYYPLYGDVARLDQDNDLRPCETLPGAP